ncbi:MAG: family 16 glycoside hydrolase [Mucilaginibacter sp.]
MKKNKYIIIILTVLLAGQSALAQHSINYDLSKILSAKGFSTTNRKVSELPNHEKNGVMLSADAGEGVAWLNGVTFTNGIIELDMRGKNVEQQSFLGIAFHGLTDTKTFDVVYFRPFNFPAADSVKRSHSIQYASHPEYPWQVLRQKFNGQYERDIKPSPNPGEWFHVRIEINSPQIKIFVNGNATPSLVVKKLNDHKSGLLGLWAGNNSDGQFANLKVTYLK